MSGRGQKRTSERIGFAPFTGQAWPAWVGAIEGPDFVAAGNMLAGPQVLARMASAFSLRGRRCSSGLYSAREWPRHSPFYCVTRTRGLLRAFDTCFHKWTSLMNFLRTGGFCQTGVKER